MAEKLRIWFKPPINQSIEKLCSSTVWTLGRLTKWLKWQFCKYFEIYRAHVLERIISAHTSTVHSRIHLFLNSKFYYCNSPFNVHRSTFNSFLKGPLKTVVWIFRLLTTTSTYKSRGGFWNFFRKGWGGGSNSGRPLLVHLYYTLSLSDIPMTAVIWLKYCRYGVKPYRINQSINQPIPMKKEESVSTIFPGEGARVSLHVTVNFEISIFQKGSAPHKI